jgi:hypothetical protein
MRSKALLWPLGGAGVIAVVSACSVVAGIEDLQLAPGDGAPDASVEASAEAGARPIDAAPSDAGTPADAGQPDDMGGDASDAGPEGGCGPLNTVDNCGACGVACGQSHASSATCMAATCAFACGAGWSDCNAAKAPNTDGCECNTPSCCPSACQTQHSNGVGQSFYDCTPVSSFDQIGALEACAAYAGGSFAGCSGGWTCSNGPPTSVCYSAPDAGGSCTDYCWEYGGDAGTVTDCTCPGNVKGMWK